MVLKDKAKNKQNHLGWIPQQPAFGLLNQMPYTEMQKVINNMILKISYKYWN